MRTKQDKIKDYNDINSGYAITGIKKMSKTSINYNKVHGYKSLYELYKTYSDAKHSSYQAILATYNPEILRVNGNSMTYSVLLKASNGDILHITRCNNYLIEVTE
jgi:hypothetical protein